MVDRTSHSRPVGIGSTSSPQWSSTTPGAHNRVDELVASLSTLLSVVDRRVLTDTFAENIIANLQGALRPDVDG